ncbi:serine/threonine-protein kinase [Dokdonella sp.]|uniref:serine/threonine-protein kinase n=1 Tax=Dokdonella sp. TaxID=2291710 RepID=UPI001B1A6FE4|nr:serine/threonine-protein kinase [Dokdonella sp.]MBO9661695.1 tetratricopeptide repeat protein [Dokdonella sp.]
MNDDATLCRRRQEREAFHALLDLDTATRAAHLAEIAAHDPALAVELRSLLDEADADASDLLDETAGTAIGSVIADRFRLLRLLGIGGMSEVYLAERTDEVAQKVALKLVRGDLPLPLARARRERQILARLNHPNIAGLIDAGIADNGRPWFAMEYVEGERITDACDHRALDLPRRAHLFGKVCRAVQFAHKNLVLHRDLKPSNILLDAEGVPKLLDFGIAKLLDVTGPRETQTLALTPAYAAPEQLRGEAATTASDIYQLGLVLYELLAGIPASKAREAAPSTPGTLAPPRLDHAFAALTAREPDLAVRIARERSVSVEKLRRQLRGDLGRIVSKATADASHERYDTAQALADDLDRWAKGLPVSAHRGSFAYRARKLVRRHALAATAIALLAVGLVATSFIAVERAKTERQQRERAEQQRQAAEQQQKRAETLLGFMRDVFHQAEPTNTNGATLDAGELLQRARARLDQRGDIDDATRAALMMEVADVFDTLGLRADALAAAVKAEEALKPLRDTQTQEYLRSAEVLASSLREDGRHEEVVEFVGQVLPFAKAHPGDSRQWEAILRTHRGDALRDLGRLGDAESDLREAVRLLDESDAYDSHDKIFALNELAITTPLLGRLSEARKLFLRVRSLQGADPSTDKLNVLVVESNIARVHLAEGHPREAIAIAEPLVAQFEQLVGKSHDRSIAARSTLARAYIANGDYDSADAEAWRIAALMEDGRAAPRPRSDLLVLQATLDLFRLHPEKVIPALTGELDAIARFGKPINFQSISIETMLGEALLQERRLDEARKQLERTRADAQKVFGDYPSLRSATIEDSLGRCYVMQGDYVRAAEHLGKAAALFRVNQGEEGPSVLRSEIHRSWARVLATHDPSQLDDLRNKRIVLVRAIGGADKPQVWQLDLLIDRLAGQLHQPGIDAAVRQRAEAGLTGLTGSRAPSYVGLNDFYY